HLPPTTAPLSTYTTLFRSWISAASPLPVRCVSMVAGCVILAAGMSLVINSNAGTGPNDLVAIILSDKLGRFQFRWVRMACDLFLDRKSTRLNSSHVSISYA